MTTKIHNVRNADLARIHTAKKQLNLTDADYRALLQSVCKVESASVLDFNGRKKVIDHLSKLLKQLPASHVPSTKAAKSRHPTRPKTSADAAPLVRRIRAQLISLGRLPDTYADGIAKQMLGTEAPEFYEWCHLDDLHKVSQALGYEQTRKGAPTK